MRALWVMHAQNGAIVAAALLTGFFAASFARSHWDLRTQLRALDQVVWALIWLLGLGLGVSAAFALPDLPPDHGLLFGAGALALSILLIVAAIRCRVMLPAVHVRFLLAAVGAMLLPAWAGVHAQGQALSTEAAQWLALGTSAAVALLGVLMFGSERWALPARAASAAKPSTAQNSVRTAAVTAQPTTDAATPESTVGHTPGQAARRLLVSRLKEGLDRSRRAEAQLALIWVSINGMEDARSVLGEEIAEQLIDGVGRQLDQAVGRTTEVCRSGASSYAAVFEAVAGMDDVLGWMDQIRQALAVPVAIGEGTIMVSSGIGHALYPHDGNDAASLCRTASRRAKPTRRVGERLQLAA